jgi:hypothetical protein
MESDSYDLWSITIPCMICIIYLMGVFIMFLGTIV